MEQRPEHEHKKQEPQLTYVNGLGFIPETPRQTEYKQLLMQYNVLLFTILLYFFLRTVVQEPILHVLLLFGMSPQNEIAVQVSSIIKMIAYMGCPAMVLYFYNRKAFHTWPFLHQPGRGSMRFGACIIIGTYALGISLARVFVSIISQSGLVMTRPAEQMPRGIIAFVLYFFSVTLLPAFLQEFLFRGMIMHSLRRFGDIVALISTTILYVLVQPTLEQMVEALIMGVILGYFTIKSGSIWVAILGNFFAKSIIMLVNMAERYSANALADILFDAAIICMLLLGIFAFVFFVKRDPQAFNIYDEETYLTNRSKIKMLFGNLGFWMAVILAFLYMIQFIQIIG